MLSLACELSAEKGNTYYVFDRGDVVKLSECCRLSFELDDRDLLDARTPWKLRFCALQNVTLNLPRLAYRSAGDRETLFDLVDHYMEVAAKAHAQKRKFLGGILAQGKMGLSPCSAWTTTARPISGWTRRNISSASSA
jgi:Oxygen-sensitive ribonucleoside-triphosphate reductase